MTDRSRHASESPPRPDREVLDELDRLERRHNGPRPRESCVDELALRRRREADDPEAILRADLRGYENVRAEHLRWLRVSVRQLRAALRQPDPAKRERELTFARDAVEHNKQSVRIWTGKVADAGRKLERLRCRWAAE